MPKSRLTLTRLPPELNLASADRAAFADCVQRALTARERQVRSLTSPLTADAMLRVPFLLGWVAVEAVRHPDLSIDAKREVVGLTLLRARPLENSGIPYGLAVLASFLAGQGALELGSFAAMLKLAEIDRGVLDSVRSDELMVLSDWLIAHPGLDDEQRLWWLWFLTVHCNDHRVGHAWLDALLAHPALDNDLKRRLCEAWLSPRAPVSPPPVWRTLDQALTGGLTLAPDDVDDDGDPLAGLDDLLALDPGDDDLEEGADDDDDHLMASFGVVSHLMRQALGDYVFVPQYLERVAMTGLVRAGEDPLVVCQKYLGADRRTPTEALNQGVADVIAAYHAQMPPEAVHALIERGLTLGQVTTRKAFYALAARLYGPGVWQRAQQDNAASIRAWAAKKLTIDDRRQTIRPTKRGNPSH